MRRLEKATIAGFRERGSDRIVDISECPVLDPELARLLPALRGVIPSLIGIGEMVRAAVNLLESGPDLLLSLPREPDRTALESLSALAIEADLCRLSFRTAALDHKMPVPVIERRPPFIRFAGVRVRPPPGVFLQATASGSEAITRAVIAGIGSSANILELFAGCGTLSFPLAKGARLHAIEGDASAAAALRDAAGAAGLAGRVSVETRNLDDRPVLDSELAAFDAVVFDPPRVGARRQVGHIAAAGPGRVVAVSCNPHTFARDARLLAMGGYRLERVIAIDQFLWSPHIELVAHFRR